ncbi:MAG: polysaccharide deacetylase family protein [Candidatus Hodarchaeota archaeon]
MLPITTLNYSTELLPPSKTSLEHVFVVNSAQIPNGTMNANEIIGLANREVEELTHILSAEGEGSKAALAFNIERSAPLASNDLDASNLERSGPLPSNSSKPLASLSMDLDNQWSYMKTHGDAGWDKFPSYFNILIPLVLDTFDQLNLKVTFFIVGQDAALGKNQEVLRLLTERGHEVGNHSFHHEPWLHLYPKDRIREEILQAEEQIFRITGQKPIGFRGPGFSWSSGLIEVLAETNYLYDASTLPTYLGPLARAYYFCTSNLTKEEKNHRKRLFGSFAEGIRPIKPYHWQVNSSQRLLEIPVTTIPTIKTPFHLSYLLYLIRFSIRFMSSYLKTALALCRMTGTEPSFLLHPLDLVSADQFPELGFFPGMNLNSDRKSELFGSVIKTICKHFQFVNMAVHARSILKRKDLKIVRTT